MTLIEKRGKRIFKGENGSGDRRIRHAPTHYDTYSKVLSTEQNRMKK